MKFWLCDPQLNLFARTTMKARIFSLFAAIFLLGALNANAETFTYPFTNDGDREKAAALLSQDPDFINLLVLNVFESRAKKGAPAASGNNMTSDNGMEKPVAPAASDRKPAVEMKNEPVAGMRKEEVKDTGLTVPKGEKITPLVATNDPSVENVDFFVSLSCIHCKDFWKKIVQDEIIRQHLVNDKIHIRIIPNSTTEAGIIVIFESLMEKNPAAARDFLTWYFTGGYDRDEKVMFRNAEKWLAERKYPGLKEIHDDSALLKRIGERVETNIALDQKYDASYPSVYVNGKEDADYFTKARNHILKQISEKK